MRHVHRTIEADVLKASKGFPALLVTGPRRAGKTTLLKTLFPRAEYYLLEDPALIDRIRTDPKAFLEGVRPPVILDEMQNVPELFNDVRSAIDLGPRRAGQWLMTGSQEAPLMQGVSESMAGRAAIFQLFPFSTEECPKVTALRGGFPEVLSRPRLASIWFRSYIQTYLERDVRGISSIRDLAVFRKFLLLLAAKTGTILNKTEIAAPMGITVPTVTQWLSILEITGQIVVVPPFFENFGKRLIKSPKVYFTDTGLLCWLLGLDSEARIAASPFAGAVFENFVASEILKHQVHTGGRKELYFFRDEQGLEVDFLVPRAGELLLIEAKAARTVKPAISGPMDRLGKTVSKYAVKKLVVHQGSHRHKEVTIALSPGVKAIPVERLSEFL